MDKMARGQQLLDCAQNLCNRAPGIFCSYKRFIERVAVCADLKNHRAWRGMLVIALLDVYKRQILDKKGERNDRICCKRL